MIHEPTRRLKDLLGDICNSCCCLDLKLCVGINCLPTHSQLLSIALLNINVGCTLQNRRLCSEYKVSAASSSTLK